MLGLILFLLLLFVAAFIAIRIPSVQTKVVQKAAAYISRTIEHEVTIGRVDIAFFKSVVLEEVQVLDRRHNEMFYIGKTEADISVFSIFDPNTLHIASLELVEPHANLVKYAGTDSLNLSSFIASLGKLVASDTTKTSKPFDFSIEELVIKNGKFTYDDFNDPRTAYGMDYFHLNFENISGRFSEIQLDDTLKVSIHGLTTHEVNSDAKLHNLDTRMTYASTFWEFDNLDLRLNQSNLQDYVRFDYNRFGNFSQFIDSVAMTVNLENSTVYSKDVAVFAPQLREYEEMAKVNSGSFKGTVSKFTARNVDINYGKNTHLVGRVSADGLPNFKEMFANLRLGPSVINAEDIKHFLPKDAYTIAARLGNVELEGRFLGFYNDFVANGTFNTQLGSLVSDINLKIDDNARTSSYRGYVKTDRFDVGRLLDISDVIKTISIDGRLAGSGFTLENARVNLNATINQLHILDYNYRNIKANGTLSRQNFIGKVAINDPNLVFNADGEIALARSSQAFNMIGTLQHANLQALRLSDVPFTISTQANLNFSGLQLDSFSGQAKLENTRFTYNGTPIALDSITIDSKIFENQRSLTLNSDLLALYLQGDFDYTTLIGDMKQLVEEYKLNFESYDPAIQAYYNRKSATAIREYSLDYNLHLRHANPLIKLFIPELSIANYTDVEGSFRYGNTAIFNLYTNIDTIAYNDHLFFQNTIELNTSKLQLSPDVLSSLLFTSARQQLLESNETQDFYLEGIWNERNIDFSTSIRQAGANNRATITGDLNFLENQVQIVFDRSNITLQENPWVFTPENTIYISNRGKTIEFENFLISNLNQTISIQGVLSDAPDSRLNVQVQDFDMANLNPLISMKLAGRLNAEVMLQGIYNNTVANASINLDSLYMDNILVGSIVGRTEWNGTQQLMNVDVGVHYNNAKVLSVTGNYRPNDEVNQLDLLAVSENAQLKLVEPLLTPILSHLEGTMEGRIRVLGTLAAPQLSGSVMVNNGQFLFDYLGTTYRFSDRVYLAPNSISFRNARVQDIYGNTATVNGGISHEGFENMQLDMEARYRNFMVLNTTQEQNELYYGTAFGTGTASVTGPADDLTVRVRARSDANTRIVLPLDNQTEVTRRKFIRFVNTTATDTTGVATATDNPEIDLSGINLDFDLDVTNNAYFEIIIDRQTGDIIRGSGQGQVRMTIDTRGDFNMYGGFEILNGAYNLNLLEGVVSREFKVVPGGTLSWNGDPLTGLMDLRATYSQTTSLRDIAPDIQGRYPVTAVIDLKGELLTPNINLGLSFEELPQDIESSASIQAFKSNVNNDPNELNRQVFSLLVLRRLSQPGTFAFNEAAGAAGSLGNLLSAQLSSFLNNLDNNLEIDIGLDGLDQNALTNLNVRLSYTFFEGRLRVTSQSGFANSATAGTAGATGAAPGYQGDWSLEYYITPSGELRGRLEYNTQPRSFANRVVNRQSLSILHTKRFNRFGELFRIERRNRRDRARDREPIILDSDPRLNL
ncbi:translocation/assembly module TamB domain-containing protein [Pontibacter sp. SGAir0037]|uniref:translocation/assembly module TamB domain-containing protein n=1 Tax=Pontibacter sp. SGAir0037 TaxID=2571030 RepID=UPI0010CD66EF|nr:translocation/assembly module TamB domain-containing protein [Pontibacter sp. SGAir0037]QCR21361.1 hypothetical protein C1N53_02695 [Pontibacter sp. SGAir0037]